jgi:septal ring factor EnvC (AmiA/AmiB activator)
MEFLKEILGDDLYKQVETKVNEHNGKAENKDKQVKVANLGNGEYVSKSKYDALETDLKNVKTSLETANNTINDLKKNNSDNGDLQKKISDYETEIADLKKTSKESKEKLIKEQAIKDALYSSKAKHPDLLLTKFDLSKIVLDENGEKVVAGIDEQIKTHKETYKDLFGSEDDGQQGSHYRYKPNGGEQKPSDGSTDFVGIIKENQARKI